MHEQSVAGLLSKRSEACEGGYDDAAPGFSAGLLQENSTISRSKSYFLRISLHQSVADPGGDPPFQSIAMWL